MNMEFLYFPEDKMEYIPAVISLIIFMAGACFAMYFLYKKSKKDEKLADEKYGMNQIENQQEEQKKDS